MPRNEQRPYERVTEDLRRRIGAEEWQQGEALPTVAVLADHYDVSGGTVAKALRQLAEEGLVRTVPRWGTFRA